VPAVLTRLSLLAVGGALAIVALTPAAGGAAAAKLAYHACDGKKYQLLIGRDPSVELLRIKMRKSRADGYAPRCLVAEATAAEVINDFSPPPKKVTVYGARWSVGTYRCTYEAKGAYTQAQCVHTGKDANTVRFRVMA
jgi:hypothetical protein